MQGPVRLFRVSLTSCLGNGASRPPRSGSRNLADDGYPLRQRVPEAAALRAPVEIDQ